MITTLILVVITNFITYIIGLYIGMKKGAAITKKVYKKYLTLEYIKEIMEADEKDGLYNQK
jgi:uncharacterized protein YebE (UPF0316 family)